MRFLPLVLLVGCAEHGDEPSTCEPDIHLVGFPGVVDENRSFLLSGGDVTELCLQLDTTRNSADVTLDAELVFSPFTLELYGVDGTPLAAGAGALQWTMPRGQVIHALLSFAIPQTIASTSVQLALDFVALPQ